MYAVIFISFSYQSLDANQVMGTLLCLPGGLAVRPPLPAARVRPCRETEEQQCQQPRKEGPATPLCPLDPPDPTTLFPARLAVAVRTRLRYQIVGVTEEAPPRHM